MKVRKGVPQKTSKYEKYLGVLESGVYIEDLDDKTAEGIRQCLYNQKKKQGLNYSQFIHKQENGLFSVGLK
mgnify:FL=1